jgi:uncharacterized membrane protein YagU involved in acid resistance
LHLWTLVALNILNWEIIRFIDWAGIIIFGDLPRSHIEGFVAFLAQLGLLGTLGIVFAFLIPLISGRVYLFKGVVYGVVIGFVFYAIPTLFQMPILKETSLATVVSNFTGGTIWGLVMAKVLQMLDKRHVS